MSLTPGQVLKERYRVVKLLGEGGFGAVYRAWDINLNGPCALKESFDTSPAAQSQFAREASLLFNLKHPNLPKVSDYFDLPGQGRYLVMEYIEGEDLEHMMEQAGGPLPEARALLWIIQVCDALNYLHTRTSPIIHRDIKPANIRITPEEQAILVDFGIAKVYNAAKRTSVAARAVTPGYAPLEQYGQQSTDARTDIYALGATLYYLLTGQTPRESISRVGGAPLVPPRQLNPLVSPNVEAAILRAMEVMPENRYQNAAAFKSALLTPFPIREEGVGARGEFAQVAPVPPPQAARSYQPAYPVAYRPVVRGAAAPASPRSAPRVARPRRPAASTGPDQNLVRGCVIVGGVVLFVAALVVGGVLGRSLLGSTPTATDTALAVAATETTKPTSSRHTRTPSPTLPEPTPTRVPSLTPTNLPDRITDAQGVSMVLIPAGKFTMGADADAVLAECQKIQSDCTRDQYTADQPAHEVSLDNYYIDLTEVTNAMYTLCVQAGACTPPQSNGSATRKSYYNNSVYANFPVIYMTWEQARTYCEWRGAELPTEAQWEKAARGTDGRLFPWGNFFTGNEANFCDKNCPNGWGNKSYNDGYADTAAVGSFPQGASPYGLLDMAGNVWEWVWDHYNASYYTGRGVWKNPNGPTSGNLRVFRGDGWNDGALRLFVTFRYGGTPTDKLDHVGFRCARTP